ncbi:MAG: DUF1804 family protein [Flavobacteriales bacterium]|jgi:transposase|nr:DUF1804 family protein [Flavobacteriales bacterium]
MAKDKEKALARVYYIDNNLDSDVIASKLNVSKKTVDRWIISGNWKNLRLAKQVAPEKLQSFYEELLQELVKKRLELERTADSSSKEKVALSDEISKVSKSLEASRKSDKPSLTAVVHVIESFMNALLQHDRVTYFKILDFHINWLQQMAEKYG